MKIYWFKTQAPRRVLGVAKHLNIDFESVPAGHLLQTPEFAALNPNKKVPVLIDGDTVLWESSAMMIYLCLKANSDLWPAHKPQDQVEVIRWLSWSDCHWAPAVGAYYFENIIKPMFKIGPPDQAMLDAKRPDVEKFAKVLDDHLKGRAYVTLDRLTIADFYLSPMVAEWREADMPLQAFPNVLRWLETLNKIPAWANPWP